MKWLTIVAVVLFTPLVISVTAAEVRQAVRDDWSWQFREINEQLRKRGNPPMRPAGASWIPSRSFRLRTGMPWMSWSAAQQP